MKDFFKRLGKKVHEGLDGLIITIGLILIVVVLLFAFKDKVSNTVNNSLDNMGTQIQNIGNIN